MKIDKTISKNILISILVSFSLVSYSQECTTTITFKLKNYTGGFYASQKIVLTCRADSARFEQITNDKGEATFNIPCHSIYDVAISNYTKKVEVQTNDRGMLTRTLTYEPNMAEKDKLFEMSEDEKSAVDKSASLITDSIYMKSSVMMAPKNIEHFVSVKIRLTDFDNKPLVGEEFVFKGVKRHKKIAAKTDVYGRVKFFVPKGDDYTLNFKYHKDYSHEEYKYTKGTSAAEINISYLGTREIERRKKEEELRLLELEKKERELRRKFEEECKRRKITLEEGYRLELDKLIAESSPDDSVIITVLKRNNWSEKLIVCDLTGSMQPYWAQLSIWYQLNYKNEKNLQFVFFNDGDDKPDNKKVIGETGGIYYSPSNGIDSLGRFMSMVTANGSGGDCEENNMEALIKGTTMAKPFKELVMIVDNNSPVKDIKLLKNFRRPVHIILCGATEGWIEPTYLQIAWKTRGTIHTIEEDITTLTRLSESQEIRIGGKRYRIMGGEFVMITDKKR